jgi:hypothetical protein
MAQIIITTDDTEAQRATEVHRERINVADVETNTAGHLLVERIGWALSDAAELEERSNERDATARFSRHDGSVADTAVL